MQKMVSRGLGIFLLAALVLPAPAPAADDVVMKAMRDELDRSMKQLQLEQLEKPYFISYRVQDRTSLDTSATFGALLSGGLARARYLTVQVRVGNYQSDNSNFMTYPPAGQWPDRKRLAPPRRRLPGIAPANLAGHRHGLQSRRWRCFPESAGRWRIEKPARTFPTSARSNRQPHWNLFRPSRWTFPKPKLWCEIFPPSSANRRKSIPPRSAWGSATPAPGISIAKGAR